MNLASLTSMDGDLVVVDSLPLDKFETEMLSVIRHFLDALQQPESRGWHRAYSIATERWGDAIGFPAAHLLARFVKYVIKVRRGSIGYVDPFSDYRNDWISGDEAALVLVLHHMRRDDTAAARAAVEDLTEGRMDPDVIRSGLTFANRFPAGQRVPVQHECGPKLRVIS